MLQENDPALNEAGAPLQAAPVTGVREAVTVPVTVVDAESRTDWSTGDETVIEGGVRSIFKVTLALVDPPEISVAAAVTI